MRGAINSEGRVLRARPGGALRAVLLTASAIGCAGLMAGLGPAASLAGSARAARTESISESASLHLTSRRGFTLNEEGSAVGTIKGKIYIHLQLQAGNRVSAEVNIYPSGGSVSGNGSATYSVIGADASFDGSFSVSRGTGSYAHAHGTGLRFTGTIQRRSDAVSVELSGRLSE